MKQEPNVKPEELPDKGGVKIPRGGIGPSKLLPPVIAAFLIIIQI